MHPSHQFAVLSRNTYTAVYSLPVCVREAVFSGKTEKGEITIAGAAHPLTLQKLLGKGICDRDFIKSNCLFPFFKVFGKNGGSGEGAVAIAGGSLRCKLRQLLVNCQGLQYCFHCHSKPLFLCLGHSDILQSRYMLIKQRKAYPNQFKNPFLHPSAPSVPAGYTDLSKPLA